MSLDFASSDLSDIKTIKGLTKSFTDVLPIFDRNPVAIRLESELHKEKKDLRTLQELMIQFIELSIKEFQGSHSIGGEFDEIKGFISDESSKFRLYDDSRVSYREAIWESKTNKAIWELKTSIVKDFVIPGLCYDFIEFKTYLDKCGYWDRIKKCSECKRFFIHRTHRTAMYCCKKCRDKSRRNKKIESGEWAKYMKEWRARTNNPA